MIRRATRPEMGAPLDRRGANTRRVALRSSWPPPETDAAERGIVPQADLETIRAKRPDAFDVARIAAIEARGQAATSSRSSTSVGERVGPAGAPPPLRADLLGRRRHGTRTPAGRAPTSFCSAASTACWPC